MLLCYVIANSPPPLQIYYNTLYHYYNKHLQYLFTPLDMIFDLGKNAIILFRHFYFKILLKLIKLFGRHFQINLFPVGEKKKCLKVHFRTDIY